RIIPMSRASVGIQRLVFIHNVEHAIAAAITGAPFLLARPTVLNIAGAAPEVTTNLFAPKPGLMRSPLANTEHNRATAGIERLSNVCVRRSRVLAGQGVAPVVFQVIHSPRCIGARVLILVTEPSGAFLTSQ